MGRRKETYCWECGTAIDPDEYEYYRDGHRICEECEEGLNTCWECGQHVFDCECCMTCGFRSGDNPECDECQNTELDYRSW